MKKLLILLCALMATITASAYDFAVKNSDGVTIYYNLLTNTSCEVTSGVSQYSGKVNIPKNVTLGGNTYSVFSIGEDAFGGCSGLTSVTIPNSITKIGDSAFSACENLTSVTIPNSVFSISKYAFSNCSSLTSVTIPESVTKIGKYAFSYCSSLTSVTIPNSITAIEENVFYSCKSLISVTISSSVTYIGEEAFRNCSALTSVTIPNSVTEIGNSAFAKCSGLRTMAIGNSVISIGADAFYSCSSLTSVTIPNSVIYIGNYAFSDCSSLKSFYGKYASSDNRCLIMDGELKAFAPYGLTSYSIPSSVTIIGDYVFSGYSGIKSVTIPTSVTTIGAGAFEDCSGLTKVTIGNSVKEIRGSAFSGCSSLTSVSIPNSVTKIGLNTFYACKNLTSVTIPKSVSIIGDYAFMECTGLTSVTVYNENPGTILLGDRVFYDVPTSTCTLYVPIGSKTRYASALQWKAFANIVEKDLSSTGGNVEVTGITLNRSRLDLVEGETSKLVATVTPSNATDKTVTWTTSNVNVATVNKSGVVTAVKAGNATITATCGSVSATCAVVVEKAVEPEITVEFVMDYVDQMSDLRVGNKYLVPFDVTSTAKWSGEVYLILYQDNWVEYQSDPITLIFDRAKTIRAAWNMDIPYYFEPGEYFMGLAIDRDGMFDVLEYSYKIYIGEASLHVTSIKVSNDNNTDNSSLTSPITMDVEDQKIELTLSNASSKTLNDEIYIVFADDTLDGIFDSDSLVANIAPGAEQTFTFNGPWGFLEEETVYCFAVFSKLNGQISNVVYFTIGEKSGFIEIVDEGGLPCDIYTLQGVRIKHDASSDDIKALNPGFYIIGGEKVFVK